MSRLLLLIRESLLSDVQARMEDIGCRKITGCNFCSQNEYSLAGVLFLFPGPVYEMCMQVF